jgi:L-2-hydroxyglutarate oxidase LhgO
VATSEAERSKLDAIRAQAEANGVGDLRPISAEEAQELEPALSCVAALLSPSTGIIDSHGYMAALLGDAEAHGAMLALNTPVVGGRVEHDGIVVETGGAEPMRLKGRLLVNAAGLGAQAVAASLQGMPADKIPPQHLAKGNYFSLAGRAPFNRLIYPIPEPGGIGVHLTLDIAGQARFGPDVEWIDALDYSVDSRRGDAFYAVIRRYWPDLEDGALQPAYAGIRPKIERPGGVTTDFMIQTAAAHGIPSLVNLFGIESPGLTSSLAIAEEVVGQIR